MPVPDVLMPTNSALPSRPDEPIRTPTITRKARRQILVHDDVVEWLTSPETPSALRRVARRHFQGLIAWGYAQRSKATRGPAKGWLRAGLGGNGGFHYYLWYATHGSLVGREFGLDEGQFIVRIVRHHDETSVPLSPGARSEYQPMAVQDLELTATEESHYSQRQKDVVLDSAGVQLIKGYPGSGKTTTLHLALHHAPPGRTLYLTHSGSLADVAQAYFDAFRPEGSTVEVMRFDEFLDYIADAHLGTHEILTPTRGADRMRDALHAPNGKWHQLVADRWDEWYAEIHAYGAGYVLPFDFRGLPQAAGDLLSGKEYVRLRKDSVGREADDIAKVIDELAQHADVAAIFRGPVAAGRLLTDQYREPPERLTDLTTVMVDEVQDLTPRELLLVLNVISRSAHRSGRMPRLILAGDESQTIRPSGFEWAVVKDLIRKVHGPAISEIRDGSLDENVRSARQIAKFVEATKSQYLRFDKQDRPAGITYTSANETIEGRLIHVHCKSADEVREVVSAVSELPRSSVVYPDNRMPPDLPSDVAESAMTVPEVKGLDFDTVVVIDAGSRQVQLNALIDESDARSSNVVSGRLLADQFRVATSRASENLILLDRGDVDGRAPLERLARRAGIESLEEVHVSDIRTLFADDDDPEEVIRSIYADVCRLVADDPRAARQRFVTGQRQSDVVGRKQPISDELRAEGERIETVTALAVLLRVSDVELEESKHLEDRARRNIRDDELLGAVDAMLTLRRADDGLLKDMVQDAVLRGLAARDRIIRIYPELGRYHLMQIRSWLDRVARADGPSPTSDRIARSCRSVLAVRDGLIDDHSEVGTLADQVFKRWAQSACDQGRFDDAMRVIELDPDPAPAIKAEAFKGLGRFEEAARSYSEAGLHDRAVQMARSIPDYDLALALAPGATGVSTARLHDLKQLVESAQALVTDRIDLTEAEATIVRDVLKLRR